MPRAAAKKTSTRKVVRRTAVRGRGAYRSEKAEKYYKKARKYKQREEDRPIGEKIGGFLGGLAQKALKAITGFGDYAVPNFDIEQNKLLENNDPPAVINKGKEFVIRHREYVGDLVATVPSAGSSSNFQIQSFALNPGDSNTFPWLYSVARNFEQYEIEGMIWEYKSNYSDAVVTSSGALGTVILATEYNAASPNFINKVQMENYEYAQSEKPSKSMCHPVECAKHLSVLSELYIRQTDSTAGLSSQDIKTYDFGNFQIATVGIPGVSTGGIVNLGEIWCSYQLRLIKPKINQEYMDSGYGLLQGVIPTTNSAGDPFQGTWTLSSGSNIDLAIVNLDEFSIPRNNIDMTYMCQYWFGSTNNQLIAATSIGYLPPTGSGSLSIAQIDGPVGKDSVAKVHPGTGGAADLTIYSACPLPVTGLAISGSSVSFAVYVTGTDTLSPTQQAPMKVLLSSYVQPLSNSTGFTGFLYVNAVPSADFMPI